VLMRLISSALNCATEPPLPYVIIVVCHHIKRGRNVNQLDGVNQLNALQHVGTRFENLNAGVMGTVNETRRCNKLKSNALQHVGTLFENFRECGAN